MSFPVLEACGPDLVSFGHLHDHPLIAAIQTLPVRAR